MENYVRITKQEIIDTLDYYGPHKTWNISSRVA